MKIMDDRLTPGQIVFAIFVIFILIFVFWKGLLGLLITMIFAAIIATPFFFIAFLYDRKSKNHSGDLGIEYESSSEIFLWVGVGILVISYIVGAIFGTKIISNLQNFISSF